uniref:Uncharacterized protein n=1 Tax=Arundo donax TaxID=35708 RepID=A0A0A8Y789_ARUDO
MSIPNQQVIIEPSTLYLQAMLPKRRL